MFEIGERLFRLLMTLGLAVIIGGVITKIIVAALVTNR